MERRFFPADEKKVMIIKAEEDTDPNYGCKPEDRIPLINYINHGIINLDKPIGPTSHEVVSWVKKIMNISKAGHSGTLDPGVSGVLPIALGKATRVLKALLTAGKEYVSIIKFHDKIELDKIKYVMNSFVGEIYQRPPLKSSVARVLRKRRIYYIDILDLKLEENMILFRVGCQAGTYIRKLCYDIGEVLLVGAHMEELRRTRVGNFKEDTLYTLHDLNDAMYIYKEENDEKYLRKIIQPYEHAVTYMKQIVIRDTAVDSICHGADLGANGVLSLDASIEKGDLIAIMTQKGELVAFGETFYGARKIASLKSGLIAKTKRVFMERKTYPYYKKERK
ncbi:MAG: RNA-guided pseudouridylation complex pseudouridine synthase subunit Cbf5 [Promethearchaeota archaeon]